eukprot:Gb_25251 [translate_table: standard]
MPKASRAKIKVTPYDVLVQEMEIDIMQLTPQKKLMNEYEYAFAHSLLVQPIQAVGPLTGIELQRKIRSARKGSGDPYPRVKHINNIRDSFILKKEFNWEVCERFTTMRGKFFGKKTTLKMAALENFIPSPWKEGQLTLKGDHTSVLQYEETKIA